MTPTELFLTVALALLMLVMIASLITFTMTFYSAVNVLTKMNESLADLAFHLQGLPYNVHGLPDKIGIMGTAIREHAAQTKALVAVIQANIGVGGPTDPKVDPKNPTDVNWTAEIPQPPDFDDGPPQPDAA